MRRVSQEAKKILSATHFPFWALSFHVYELTGESRYGGGQFRVLYAGTRPFLHYFKKTTFAARPKEAFLGTHNILALDRIRRAGNWDVEIFRGHRLFASLGFFPSGLFVPEWISGICSLEHHENHEHCSRSRRRDRAQLQKNNLSYAITTRSRDLNYFYEEMYLDHMQDQHGGAVCLMSREEMMSRVHNDNGELVMIYRGAEPVAGSLIYMENSRPRLFSQGVLQNDKELLRAGVGTAVYLFSLDHLSQRGFKEINMGWTRALLSDGSLYFKQRFGLCVSEASAIGHFLTWSPTSDVARKYLENTGFIHCRRGVMRGALFRASGSDASEDLVNQKLAQCKAIGLHRVNVTDLRTTDAQSAVCVDRVDDVVSERLGSAAADRLDR